MPMGKVVKTPLAVVYVDEKFNMRVSDDLELSRVSQVWGVFLYIEVTKQYLFISKSNGLDLTAKEVGEWAYKEYKSYYDVEHQQFLYAGLPHYGEMLMLIGLGYTDKLHKTMNIFRQNGIVSDNLFDDEYFVYSEKVFADEYDLHLRRIMQQKEIDEVAMYQLMRPDNFGEKITNVTPEIFGSFNRYHTRLFLHLMS